MTSQRTHFAVFDQPLHLDCGRELESYTIAYQTWGELNADRSNAILLFHALTGDAHVAGVHEDGRTGWWDKMMGPGRGIDTGRYFVVCANILGGCKGSTGPSSPNPATGKPYGSDFPIITLEDIVRAQHPLLARLGIEKLHAIVGPSMGGMVTLACLQLYPEITKRAILLACSWTNHAQAIAWNEIGRRAVMDDPHWRGGHYPPEDPPKHGLALSRMMGHVTYMSESALDRKFGRKLQVGDKRSFTFGIDYAIESYLAYQGRVFHERFDANSYLYLTRALDYFNFADATGDDLAAAFARVRARFSIFSYSADWLYSPERHEIMTQAALAGGRQAIHHRIEAPLGHDAFLVLEQPQSDLMREFLA